MRNVQSKDVGVPSLPHQVSQIPSNTGALPPAKVPKEDLSEHSAVKNDPTVCVELDRDPGDSGISVHSVHVEEVVASTDTESLETVQPTMQAMDVHYPRIFPSAPADFQPPDGMVCDVDTPADSQRTEDEENVAHELLPETPVSIPSLLLPSMSASRSSSVFPQSVVNPVQYAEDQVPCMLPSDALASDKVQLPGSSTMDWLAPLSPLTSELSESGTSDDMLLSQLASRARGSPDTQTRGVGHCSEPSSDGPAIGSIAPSLTTTNLNGDHGPFPSEPPQGGPSASLSELTHLARRERQPTWFNSEPRKRNRKQNAGRREGRFVLSLVHLFPSEIIGMLAHLSLHRQHPHRNPRHLMQDRVLKSLFPPVEEFKQNDR